MPTNTQNYDSIAMGFKTEEPYVPVAESSLGGSQKFPEASLDEYMSIENNENRYRFEPCPRSVN